MDPSPTAVRVARSGERGRVLDTLALAFVADPACRWMYPDPHVYLASFPAFCEALGGAAIERGSAFVTADRAGAALWLPPDAAPDEAALGALFEATVADDKKPDMFAVFEAMGRSHPTKPHWYLPLIGVDVARQGRGLGAALMREGLALCDRDRLPAYLEATNPQSVPLYERHGFTLTGEIRIGSCPPIFPMVREKR